MLCCRYVLKQQVGPKRSTLQLAEVNERRVALHRRIANWQDTQTFYMPAVAALRVAETSDDDGVVVHAEGISLYLPSQCPRGLVMFEGLADMEKRLRLAQADDALIELRRLLRVTAGLWNYKFSQVGPSQRAGTRAQTLITRFQEKINNCANRYRVARYRLAHLDPGGEWVGRLLELKPEHVKGPWRGEDDESEGRRELSWIWMVNPSLQHNLGMRAGEDEIGESKN